MGDNAFNGIVDTLTSTTATLTNVDNTISGAGVIGSGGILGGGTLTLVNQAGGVINATGVNNPLILNTPGATLTNNGLIEATTGAGLNIAATTVDGSGGGVIVANDSLVRLEAAVIVGGTLKTFNAARSRPAAGPPSMERSPPCTTRANSLILDGNSLLAQGAIDNTGIIDIEGRASGASMVLSGNLTLTGGGGVLLEDNASNYIQASTTTGTLTNVDNTITADGQLGAGQLILVNQAGGVIKETGKSGLTIDTGAAAITNAGLIETDGRHHHPERGEQLRRHLGRRRGRRRRVPHDADRPNGQEHRQARGQRRNHDGVRGGHRKRFGDDQGRSISAPVSNRT